MDGVIMGLARGRAGWAAYRLPAHSLRAGELVWDAGSFQAAPRARAGCPRGPRAGDCEVQGWSVERPLTNGRENRPEEKATYQEITEERTF